MSFYRKILSAFSILVKRDIKLILLELNYFSKFVMTFN
jgi:hypothetical protein